MNILFSSIAALGLLLMGLIQIIGIGYLIYNWGYLGISFAHSTWLAFVLYIQIGITGVGLFLVGMIGKTYTE